MWRTEPSPRRYLAVPRIFWALRAPVLKLLRVGNARTESNEVGGVVFFRPYRELEVTEIAPVVPACPRCRTMMHMDGIFPHPRLPRVEIVSFKCDCGEVEKRIVPHSYRAK